MPETRADRLARLTVARRVQENTMPLTLRRLFPAVLVLLSFAAIAAAQMPDRDKLRQTDEDPKAPLEIVSSYLTMVEQMRDSVVDPLTVLIIAQHDMKEIFKKNGTPADAVKEFRRILEGLDVPAARSAVHFSIVDVYESAGEADKALAELRVIVDEAKARLATEK